MTWPPWKASLRGGAFALLASLSAQPVVAQAPARVLVVYPETTQLPGIVDIGRGLRSALNAGMAVPPRVYEEYLDFRRFPGLASDDALRRWFAYKYRDDRPDLIVAVTALPLAGVAQPGREIWPGVPVVFLAVDQAELPHLRLPVESTGLTFRWPVERTITLIQRILPRVRHLIVPSGTDAFDRLYRDVFRRAVLGADRVEYEEWTDVSLAQMKERLRHAPEDAAVFATMISGDREVPSMVPMEMARALAAASPRPVFGMTRTHLGTGMVGGWLLDPEVIGRRGGELAVRVLRGTPASRIPVAVRDDLFVPVFDARALHRFGIQRSALPAGAEILYDEVPVFVRYRWQILSGLGLLVLQSALIGLLLRQRHHRVQAQQRLDSRLRFEQLLSDVAATLSRVSRHEKAELARLFERIAHAFGADRVGVLQWGEQTSRPTVVDAWRRVAPATGAAEEFDLPVMHQAARRGEVIRWDSREEVPRASGDLEAFTRAGADAMLVVPVARSGSRTSSMGVGRPRSQGWTDEDVERVKAVAEHFSAWVRRQWAEADAEASQALTSAVVASMVSHAAVVDTDGVIWWLGAAPGSAVPPWLPDESGVDILEALEARGPGDADAARLLEAIRGVMTGGAREITAESRFATLDDDQRYCEMRVRALERPDGGVAITFQDVTSSRRLELENQARLHDIAHLDRVASLGALATSLAHELNQPLTAILTNAQAAQVMLQNGSASPHDVRDILADIVEDDRRAGDIIHRMRRMLKKGDVQAETVDLNAVGQDALRLVAGRATRQHVTIDQALARTPVRVSGDSVQLQQVVVNLLLNAIDASAARGDGPRRVRIETRTTDGEGRVAVHDTGAGVAPNGLARLFQPFFSTKQEGLGMGLSISRTIVEAHRGRIWAENGADGAVFHLAFAGAPEGDA